MTTHPAMSATRLRRIVLDLAYSGNAVHIGCAFSIVEVLAVLYRDLLRFPGNDPESPMRDYLVLSKGHGVMAQYACMRELGWLDDADIANYFGDGTSLKGLSDSRVPGLEVSSGSLGHGFSVGVGLAFGASLKGTDQRTYAIVGDGEANEGSIWEGALFAAHHRLRNFMVIVDANGFQAMGRTKDILDLGSLEDKFRSFGFEAVTIDGHDEQLIHSTVCDLWVSSSDRPKAIVASTVKGHGVDFMADDNAWHYTRLDPETYRRAIKSLGGSTS